MVEMNPHKMVRVAIPTKIDAEARSRQLLRIAMWTNREQKVRAKASLGGMGQVLQGHEDSGSGHTKPLLGSSAGSVPSFCARRYDAEDRILVFPYGRYLVHSSGMEKLTNTEQDRRVADERGGPKGVQDVWASAAEESVVQDAKGALPCYFSALHSASCLDTAGGLQTAPSVLERWHMWEWRSCWKSGRDAVEPV